MGRLRRDSEATGGTVIDVSKPTEIPPGVWRLGPVPRVHRERNFGAPGKVWPPAGDVEDVASVAAIPA